MPKMPATSSARLGIVIVSYGHEKEIARLVESFTPQLRDGDTVVVVDNKKPWQLTDAAGATIVQHDNGGFAAGCNVGAGAAGDVDVLFFLNPDTYVEDPNLLDVVRAGYDTDLAAWMPYLVLPDGTINSAGNALHISGLSWVNGYGDAPKIANEYEEIAIASGACLAVRRQWWEKLGGMAELYFMYHEDTDFSARVLLAGGKIGLVHGAVVHHDYDYAKGDYKWIYIERNRLVFILGTWPASVILVLMPQLLAVGVGLWAIAAIQGRLGLKVQSTKLLVTALPKVWRFRRAVRKQRAISGADFLAHMDASVDNPFLGAVADNPIVAAGYRAYYQLASKAIRRK